MKKKCDGTDFTLEKKKKDFMDLVQNGHRLNNQPDEATCDTAE